MKRSMSGLAIRAALFLAPAVVVAAILFASFAAVDPGSAAADGRTFAAAPAATRVAAADAETLKHGQTLLTEKCGRCHGIGRGDASRNDKAPPFRTLSKRYPIEALEEALGEGIISGHPDMPEFEFDSDDVGAIIAYLKSIQDK